MTDRRSNFEPFATHPLTDGELRLIEQSSFGSVLYKQFKTHPFTCASYNPFEVLNLDHIGPLKPDTNGNIFIWAIIDAFSRWVEIYPTKTTTAAETASCIFQHFGRFDIPKVVHTDRGTAFHKEFSRRAALHVRHQKSLTTAYSCEENGIVGQANQEVLRHLNTILFDSLVHDRAAAYGAADHEYSGENIYGCNSSSAYFK
jgi:hypothetical protein